MPLRTLLLRLMLWSLALAAATGVLAVLFQGGDLVWRVVGTGLATAAACGLLIPTSVLIDRESTRSAGLLGMGVVIAEFLIALGLIWGVLQALLAGMSDAGGRCILTMVLLGLAAIIVMSMIGLRRRASNRVAGVFCTSMTVAILVVFLIATWWPDWIFRDDEWWETGGTLLLFGALTTMSLLQLSRETPRIWRWLGVAANLTVTVMLLLHVWVGEGTDFAYVVFCGFLAIGSVVAHANVCLAPNLRTNHTWVRNTAIFFATVTATLIVLVIANDKFPEHMRIDGERFGRFAAAAGIIAGCGTLAILILARLNRGVDLEPSSAELSQVRLFCPRCRKDQKISVGDSSCGACGLRISIRVEEPRCAHCDYLLHALTSDRCPECGNLIAPQPTARPPEPLGQCAVTES